MRLVRVVPTVVVPVTLQLGGHAQPVAAPVLVRVVARRVHSGVEAGCKGRHSDYECTFGFDIDLKNLPTLKKCFFDWPFFCHGETIRALHLVIAVIWLLP